MWQLIGIGFFGLMISYAAMRIMRERARRRDAKNRHRRCVCGYIVEHLGSPRCPECGRAIGFDATFEELGISQSELDEAARRKALRGGRKS